MTDPQWTALKCAHCIWWKARQDDPMDPLIVPKGYRCPFCKNTQFAVVRWKESQGEIASKALLQWRIPTFAAI